MRFRRRAGKDADYLSEADLKSLFGRPMQTNGSYGRVLRRSAGGFCVFAICTNTQNYSKAGCGKGVTASGIGLDSKPVSKRLG